MFIITVHHTPPHSVTLHHTPSHSITLHHTPSHSNTPATTYITRYIFNA